MLESFYVRVVGPNIYSPFCFRRPSTISCLPSTTCTDPPRPQAVMLTSMPLRPPPLSRTSSSSSVVSVSVSDDGSKGGSKRTRKRFSQEQLIVLEQVFQKTSHPSKGEREAMAKQTGMYVFFSHIIPGFFARYVRGAQYKLTDSSGAQGSQVSDNLVPE